MNLTPSDIMWNTADTGWVKSAWSSVFAPWISGSCVFVHHMPQFKPAVIAEVSVTFYTVSFISILRKAKSSQQSSKQSSLPLVLSKLEEQVFSLLGRPHDIATV